MDGVYFRSWPFATEQAAVSVLSEKLSSHRELFRCQIAESEATQTVSADRLFRIRPQSGTELSGTELSFIPDFTRYESRARTLLRRWFSVLKCRSPLVSHLRRMSRIIYSASRSSSPMSGRVRD
jgi:hypothetical protein